jgi:DNA invertase Pin-like site-specific DNA recombinase
MVLDRGSGQTSSGHDSRAGKLAGAEEEVGVAKTVSQTVGDDSVLYLRVSSPGQVNTDYNPEGISLPAPRIAGTGRASELNSTVVEEFIDPGRSAKSIEERPEFQKMVAYLRAHPNVRYVIVYALSRFARNRHDDAIMMVTLGRLSVELISATERNLDDTPAGQAMHGMITVFNEYQVRVSGDDIKYKMGQKAINGGTITRAKLGYNNVRITYEGREIRTVEVDELRAPYVKMAFELYATGQYSFPDLRAALTDAGLRMRPNRRHGPRPISIHKIGEMLRDRYYLGYVTYQGVEYPHPRLPRHPSQPNPRTRQRRPPHPGGRRRSPTTRGPPPRRPQRAVFE